MRWKALILAHPTEGQTWKSDTLGPTWRLLNSLDYQNRSAEIRDSGPTRDFNSRHVGPKVSETEVWPAVECPRIRALQRTSNQYRTATFLWTFGKNGHLRHQRTCMPGTIRTPAVCGPILLQFSEKSPHRLSKVSHCFDSNCAGKL